MSLENLKSVFQDELQQRSGLEKVMYIGSKNLDEYDRYMIIGTI